MSLYLEVKTDENAIWHLYAGNRSMRCAIGKSGVTANKREGDNKTPLGDWKLLYGYYRADRITPPQTALPLSPLTPNDGWCDDPEHALYNQHVILPFSASHEKLWREDNLYDLILVIDHNSGPARPGNGSAIFLHIARPDYTGTEGCIALSRSDWFSILPELHAGTKISIQN